MVVRERTVRVHASIPASQADALKALAAASGVPLARAVHYAVERLLDVARREGALAVTGGLAPTTPGETGGDSVAEVAEALDLRLPGPEPAPGASVRQNGEPVLAAGADRESDQTGEQRAEQPGAQGSEQPGAQAGEQVAAPPPAAPADASQCAAGDAAG